MDRPVKSRPETSRGHTVQVPQSKLRRSVKWLVLLALAVAGVFCGTREKAPSACAGGGRGASVISIVPQVVGKGDIGINPQCARHCDLACNRDGAHADQRLPDEDRFQGRR